MSRDNADPAKKRVNPFARNDQPLEVDLNDDWDALFADVFDDPASIEVIAKGELAKHKACTAKDTARIEVVDKSAHQQKYKIEARPAAARVVFKSVGVSNDTDQRVVLQKYRTLLGKALPLLPGNDITDELEQMARISPWLESALQVIQRSMRLGSHRPETGFQLERPILLVGPPGIGKSWLVSQIRQRLGLPSMSISAAGKIDNVALRGTARGWSSAREGDVVQLIAEHGCANPLVIIDELDKVSPETRNGNLQQTLLQMFEPLNARQWRDEFLLGEVDLSAISWLATANTRQDIIAPLLDRMDIIHLQGPRNPDEKRLMLRSMAWDVAQTYGLRSPKAMQLPVTWPDYIQDEELIQYILKSGENFRIFRKILAGILDRWLLAQKMRLM